jgi:hypothetical protein
LPDGSKVPVAGFTATLSEVVPPGATVPGLAVTVRLVTTAGVATVAVTGEEAEEANAGDPP